MYSVIYVHSGQMVDHRVTHHTPRNTIGHTHTKTLGPLVTRDEGLVTMALQALSLVDESTSCSALLSLSTSL